MKRLISIIAMILVLAPAAGADEGMWLLDMVKKTCGKDMRKAGCRLSPEEIYSVFGV
ncbi:MAG: hypothetical protein HUJ94_05015, partial [Bacteroidales bacterium]|nr:hypothetical protein [Bacteroidales bacterium]